MARATPTNGTARCANCWTRRGAPPACPSSCSTRRAWTPWKPPCLAAKWIWPR
ncbi:Uncharacterised protein [Bordetella pertussis]|nr:Uncharacterised protein [Bordetella pertussis]